MQLSKVSDHINGKIIGDPHVECTGVASLFESTQTSLTFLLESRYIDDVKGAKFAAIITGEQLDDPRPQIIVQNPRKAMCAVLDLFHPPAPFKPGISEKSDIHPSAQIAENVRIDAFVSIGENTVIESGVHLHSSVSLGANCYVAENTQLFPNVVCYDQVKIGRNCRIHSGTIIGCDGFGYYQEDGRHVKVPHVGGVVIDDDVELGSNNVIDRSVMGNTYIGAGTKMDNLVHIAHNVKMGKHNIILSQSGMQGHAQMGDYNSIAGQAGVASVTLGSGIIIAARSGVTRPLKDKQVVSGFPAQDHKTEMLERAALKRIIKQYQKKRTR